MSSLGEVPFLINNFIFNQAAGWLMSNCVSADAQAAAA